MSRIHVVTIRELTDQGWTTVADLSYETENVPMRADRGLAKQAKQASTVAQGTAGQMGQEAQQAYGALIPGVTRDESNPTGYTPQQQNQQLVRQQEAVGGGNAAIGGEGRLAALRTRTAGGFAPAMAEAARAKGRTLATGALDVANRNAELQQQKQQQARQMLAGLYGTNTSNMLRAMGLQSEDIGQELAAGRQGWVQNATNVLGALQGAGKTKEGFAL